MEQPTQTPALIASRFELGATIGRGAMGTVYLGRDTTTDEKVAIKQLRAAIVARRQQRGGCAYGIGHGLAAVLGYAWLRCQFFKLALKARRSASVALLRQALPLGGAMPFSIA